MLKKSQSVTEKKLNLVLLLVPFPELPKIRKYLLNGMTLKEQDSDTTLTVHLSRWNVQAAVLDLAYGTHKITVKTRV